jgi:hypothetical protein
MFFIVQSSEPRTDLVIYRAKRRARLTLALYPMGTTETLLSRYLEKQFGMSLQIACRRILANTVYVLNMRQEIIVTISDPNLNHIAKIITYGTGSLMGSNILRDMLTIRKEKQHGY